MTYGNIRADWHKVLKRSGRKRADPAMKTNTEAWGTDTTTSGGSHSHAAENVSIEDAGSYYTSTDVEGALQEIGTGGIGGTTGVAVEEDGAEEGAGIDRFDFTTGLDVSVSGTQATISSSGIAVEEDGVEEGAGINRLDFSTGLDVSVTGAQATISATGGGGGGGGIDDGHYEPLTTGESPGEFVFDDDYDIVMGWVE